VKKQEILDHIQEAIRREESATGIYMKHMASIVLRSGLGADEISKIRTTINILVKENNRHKAILESLSSKISQEPLDVY